MLGADQGATARRAARDARRSTGRSRRNHDAFALIALDQRVVDFLVDKVKKVLVLDAEVHCDHTMTSVFRVKLRIAFQ